MAKTKVNITFDEENFSLKVKQSFAKVKKSKQLNTEIGTFLVGRIRGEAKRGRPFNKTRSYPELKTSTIATRKRLAELNGTSTPFRPGFSNTTITGQLLNALEFKVKEESVIIQFMDKKRNPYTINEQGGKQKLKAGINATNQDLAKTLKEIGFIVFDASVLKADEKIIKRIRSIVLRFLRRSLRVLSR